MPKGLSGITQVMGVDHSMGNEETTNYLGIASSTITSPTQTLYVTIDSIDAGAQLHGPVIINNGLATFPAEGDTCLIAYDESGHPWLIAWSHP